ncbi:ATP-binding cassette domain-containing protein [Cohnella sp. GbtcB17]|uniref:ATP-binding cassette domain-containing protein n=1 Tax=Cohnella sp. GbtcB17 TaxID=2824762 RepID=UPI0034D42EEB
MFQNTKSALNPRMTVFQSLEEPLLHYSNLDRRQRRDEVHAYAARVGLPMDKLPARPNQLSGGQYQRACIARALIAKPQLLVCDEIVSNLDMIHQVKIITLLKQLKSEAGISLLFITHDLRVVRELCDEVLVMVNGSIKEKEVLQQ